MAGSFNRATLIGRLGRDPEVRTLNSGDRVCNLSLATEESWRDKSSGERKSVTEWHRIVIFNDKLVEIAEQYLKKGALVLVEGAIKTRKWMDKDEVEKYSTEIVLQKFGGTIAMLGDKGDGGGGREEHQAESYSRDGGGGGNQSRHQRPAQESFSADLDDEIPF